MMSWKPLKSCPNRHSAVVIDCTAVWSSSTGVIVVNTVRVMVLIVLDWEALFPRVRLPET